MFDLGRKKSPRSTILTARQWQVIRHRAKGITQAELAKLLNTSRENISEIEHRARMKIEAARKTLAALQEFEAKGEVLIPNGTFIFEAVFMVIMRADILGIRLRGTVDDMLAAFRARWKNKIRDQRLTSAVKVVIERDGSLLAKDTTSTTRIIPRSARVTRKTPKS